jgi:hypothetical protein
LGFIKTEILAATHNQFELRLESSDRNPSYPVRPIALAEPD